MSISLRKPYAPRVAHFVHNGVTHAIKGIFRFDRPNQTACGLEVKGTSEHGSHKVISITCRNCLKVAA